MKKKKVIVSLCALENKYGDYVLQMYCMIATLTRFVSMICVALMTEFCTSYCTRRHCYHQAHPAASHWSPHF